MTGKTWSLRIFHSPRAGNPHRNASLENVKNTTFFRVFLQGNLKSDCPPKPAKSRKFSKPRQILGNQLSSDLQTAGRVPGDPRNIRIGLRTKKSDISFLVVKFLLSISVCSHGFDWKSMPGALGCSTKSLSVTRALPSAPGPDSRRPSHSKRICSWESQ